LRTRWLALLLAAVFCGALGGTLFAPQPAGAVSKEMIELQQQVTQILQAQQDLRSTVDGNNAAIRTLVQQSLDSVGKLSGEMGSLQKAVQEVQANTGARIDTMTQQTQGLSDNMQDVQAPAAEH
jgi:ABC-type transporter Mla subunit MlaD